MPTDEAYMVRQVEELRRQIKELGPSVAKSFRGTVAKLQAQADDIAAQTTHLASLKTSSAGNATFNTGTITAGPDFHWYDAPTPLQLTAPVPTGHVLVTIGCGQVTLAPGDSAAIAAVTFQITTPSGWTYPIEIADARLYTTQNRMLGVPLIVSTPAAVPYNEPCTFTVKFGLWSASSTDLASAQFDNGYINVQVIDA
jgi:hypothetical protein